MNAMIIPTSQYSFIFLLNPSSTIKLSSYFFKTSTASELTNSEKQSYSEFIRAQVSPQKDLINSLIKSQITVLNSRVKPEQAVETSEAPKLPTSLPPVLLSVNEAHNDSSDDEVKDYLSLRDASLDEISHV